ncbi:uncharacterized protein LTR77_002543 [Saxophila tyrrhenica]|uniref:catechol O-methyltransferase n=1 Tax=Saxophila tyrrhenica TaxID=1690608 RepID=A0AAV9PLI9_9PEZI|nr:hypothetical protein LTR77_002543 [Saxophila tyrrhenica]
MSDNDSQAQAEWQRKLQLYPSLKKFEEQGDDFVESHDGREERLLAFIKAHPSFSSMQGNPSLILKAMDEYAYQQDFLINIGEGKGRILSDLIAKQKPKVLVELGGYVGYSAIHFAGQMLKAANNPSEVHLWSLEFDANFAAIASELIALAGLKDIVTVVVGSADETLRKLKSERKLSSIDFFFLDHVEDLYEQDFKVAMDELKLLGPGAVVVADNVVRPGAPKYREHVRSRSDVKSEGVKGLIMPGELEVGPVISSGRSTLMFAGRARSHVCLVKAQGFYRIAPLREEPRCDQNRDRIAKTESVGMA